VNLCLRCTSYMAVTNSDRILAAFGSSLLVFSPTPVSRSAWRNSSPTDRSGVLADVDAMGISTLRAGAAALCIASVEDTTGSIYDFHSTHDKTSLLKIGFICLLEYFIFLTRAFRCLSGRLKITTSQRIGMRFRRHPLQHDGRIRRQRCGFVVLVLLSLAVVSVLLSLSVNYSLELSNLFCFHVS
jgi:hypothetical protein